MPTPTVQITLRVPGVEYAEWMIVAKTQGVSLTEFVREAVRAAVDANQELQRTAPAGSI